MGKFGPFTNGPERAALIVRSPAPRRRRGDEAGGKGHEALAETPVRPNYGEPLSGVGREAMKVAAEALYGGASRRWGNSLLGKQYGLDLQTDPQLRLGTDYLPGGSKGEHSAGAATRLGHPGSRSDQTALGVKKEGD
jgi:hypothetical protein